MPGKKGSAMLIKAGDGSGNYTTIGGGRTTGMTLNNEMVDTTTAGATKWRELLEQAGVQSITLSLAGVYKAGAQEKIVRSRAFSNSQDNYQFVDEDGSTVTGAFQITSYEYTGEYNAEQTFTITFESAGDITTNLV